MWGTQHIGRSRKGYSMRNSPCRNGSVRQAAFPCNTVRTGGVELAREQYCSPRFRLIHDAQSELDLSGSRGCRTDAPCRRPIDEGVGHAKIVMIGDVEKL